MSSRIGLLQVCAAGVLWGTGGLAVQVIREDVAMDSLTISAYRVLIAAVALVALVLITGRWRATRALMARSPGHVAVVGSLTALYQALYFASVVAVGVTVATVVSLGLAPVLLTIHEAVTSRRRPSVSSLAVVSAALTGLVLVSVSSESGATGPHPVLGVVLAIASGSTYAAATTIGRPLAQASDPFALVTATTSVGALVLLPFGLIASRGDAVLVTGDTEVLVWLVYLGVATMALAYGLLYAGLRHTTGSAAVIATLLEPVTAAVAAAALLDERLTGLGIAGTLLILAAVAGLARRPEVPL